VPHSPFRPVRAAPLAALLLLLPLARSAGAEDRVNDEARGYSLTLPDGWTREGRVAAWDRYDIVFGATKTLLTRKDGRPADGHGAQVHVAVGTVPAGADLDALAADPAQRDFLLARFESAEGLDVEAFRHDEESGLEARALRIDGRARDLGGKFAPARGALVLVLAGKRLYRLRLIAWHTEHDDEGLKSELDLVEAEWTVVPPIDDGSSTPEGPPPAHPEGEEPDAPRGDVAERKVVDHLLLTQGWRLTKPVGIRTKEFDPQEHPETAVWFEDSDRGGGYAIQLQVYRKGRIVDGQRAQDYNLREWLTTQWVPRFLEEHPEGTLSTYAWDRRAEFLSLPQFGSETVLAAEPSRRPPSDATPGDLLKVGYGDKVKGKIGRVRLVEAWRGCLAANRPRYGPERVLRFGWNTNTHTFMLYVTVYRDGLARWQKPIQELLDSFELVER
jgi:hypothetical protein